MKRNHFVFDVVVPVCVVVAHIVLFNRVMNQFDAAENGDLQQLRVALTVENVNDGNEYSITPCCRWWIC
jgi:hypothetical protein